MGSSKEIKLLLPNQKRNLVRFVSHEETEGNFTRIVKMG